MRLDGFRGALAVLDPEVWSEGWWELALWVPAGYASTRLYGPALPTVAVGVGAVAVALVHRFARGPVEAVAGAAGLVGGVLAAHDGDCYRLVGDDGAVVLAVFGGIMCTSAAVRLLGAGNLREAGRHLLVGAVSLELALAVVAPLADTVRIFRGRTSTAVVLGVVLVVLAVVGVRARTGLALLGVTLVVTEVVMSVTGGPCHETALRTLVGLVAFAAVATYLAQRAPRDPEPDEIITVRGHIQAPWTGRYEGRGPGSGPEPPSADEWPGRARRERDPDDFW